MSDEQATAVLFPEYLSGMVEFSRLFFERSLELTSDDPDIHPTVRALAGTAVEAMMQTAEHLRRTYGQLDANARQIVDRQIQLSGGMTLVRSAVDAVASPGARSRLSLSFIGVIIHLLKKLVARIFSLLGKTVQKWLEFLLEFIDEVWQIVQELLGGRVASRLAHQMTIRRLTVERLLNAAEAARSAPLSRPDIAIFA